jgi:hypothetical protein
MNAMNKQTKELPQSLTKVLQVVTKAVTPTDQQIERIRPYLLRDFSPDELYIRQMELANDQYDRSDERFDAGYLRRFAETIVGKSVLMGHRHSAEPLGRFFEASVGVGSNNWQWVLPWFYMPKSPGNQLARDNIDSGVWSYVSIGANVDYAGLVCDICGQCYLPWLAKDETAPECPHIAGKEYNGRRCTLTWDSSRSDLSKVEAVEGSIVYLGCQYDAAIAKAAETTGQLQERKQLFVDSNIKSTITTGGESMLTEAEVKALQDENERLKTEAEASKAKIEELTPKAADGDKYRAALKAEIVRLAVLIGDEESAKCVTEVVDDVTKLEGIKASYEKRWDEKQPPKGQGEVGKTGETNNPETRPVDDRAFRVI